MPTESGLRSCGAPTARRDDRSKGPASTKKILGVLKWRDQLFVHAGFAWTDFRWPPRTYAELENQAVPGGPRRRPGPADEMRTSLSPILLVLAALSGSACAQGYRLIENFTEPLPSSPQITAEVEMKEPKVGLASARLSYRMNPKNHVALLEADHGRGRGDLRSDPLSAMSGAERISNGDRPDHVHGPLQEARRARQHGRIDPQHRRTFDIVDLN